MHSFQICIDPKCLCLSLFRSDAAADPSSDPNASPRPVIKTTVDGMQVGGRGLVGGEVLMTPPLLLTPLIMY